MEPRNINDFIPLMRLNPIKLNKISKICIREYSYIQGGNRVYFFSEKFNIEPSIVSLYFSTHPFMFDIPFASVLEKVGIFVKYKVAPINMIRDLWAFKYTPNSIKKRLERATIAQKDKLMPWMVRCPEPILSKSLQLSTESKMILGENETVLDYLAKRLDYDLSTTKYLVSKHPAVLKVRVTKVS